MGPVSRRPWESVETLHPGKTALPTGRPEGKAVFPQSFLSRRVPDVEARVAKVMPLADRRVCAGTIGPSACPTGRPIVDGDESGPLYIYEALQRR